MILPFIFKVQYEWSVQKEYQFQKKEVLNLAIL